MTRFRCSEKENTVFTDPRDRQVKHYFLLSTWNLYLREIIFVIDVGVLTIETFLIKRRARVQTSLSETISAVSFLKTLRYLYEAFEIREKSTPAKKVAGGKPILVFSLQHKTFSALNYAQDFATTVKQTLKRTTSSN